MQFYPDFSDTADALLRNASGHVRDGQWGEAIDIYQRVIQQYGDKVAKLPKDDAAGDRTGESLLFVDLRHFCQRRLAALPAEALEIYRRRVDSQAERWYKQGVERRDRAALRRLIDQNFCSSWGDDALDLLGDLAFEDGRFEEAIAFYRQLVPDSADDRTGLVYPDPGVDLARVAAKKILCRAALGEPAPDAAALEAYNTRYPNASGMLAGRNGLYLKSVIAALRSDRLAPPAQSDGRWPTFAGSPTRTKVTPSAIDVGSLQWRVALPAYDPIRRPSAANFNPQGSSGSRRVPDDRLLSYHPIVVGDQVVVATENKVLAYNLNDRPEGQGPAGSPSPPVAPVWEAPPDNQENSTQATLPSLVVPRHTLTTFGDRIYARLGPANSIFPISRTGGASLSRIIALDRRTEGKILWSVSAGDIEIPRRPAESNNRIGFEGTPIADARNVYVALTERREQTSTYVACLDAENGRLRWVRYLGAAAPDGDNLMPFGMGGMGMGAQTHDFGHRLLTLDGPTVYYQTNLGAVVALDSESGGVRWVATYPRQDRSDGGARQERDLNPAIVYDGLVIVAPDDAVCLYAFDAASGRLVWKSEPVPSEVKLAHVLGVAKGRLIATGDRVLSFDVKTGKLLSAWPDSGHAYDGFGRGLLAGDRIYWPTRGEIHILDQASGLKADPSIKLQETYQTSGGNLAVGDGYLIVAQADALVVFCQNSRLIQRYRDAIARAPEDATNYFRLAQAAEATGQDEAALEAFAQSLTKSRASQTIDGATLADAARDHQYRLLLRLGKRATAARSWDQAAQRFDAASQAARLDRDRLNARLRLAEVETERGTPGSAVDILQNLLESPSLRSLSLATDDGRRTVRADLLVGDRLTALVQKHGRSLYAAYDAAALNLLEQGRDQKSARLLEEVERSYPVAQVVPDALLARARLSDALNRPAEAAQAYKRLLAVAANDELRARALWGLAAAYEAQRLWVPARDAYVEALHRFSPVRIETVDRTESRIGDLATERLAREPFAKMASDRAEPSLPVPLVRRWSRTLDRPVRPLSAQGVPPSASASRIFLADGRELAALDPNTGNSRWSADLGGKPVWVGYLADKVVAATESRLTALSLDKGTVQWVHELDAAPHGRGPDPFAKPEAEAPAENAAPDRLHGFQIVGSRVFCLRGEHELRALDGDTGLPDWTFSTDPGVINPLVLIGPQRIVLQVLRPNAVLVLETEGGRREREFPHESKDGWLRVPLALDDEHVALVTDRRTVVRFDLRDGAASWVFRESDKLPKNGAPRLLGNAEALLVIHDGAELIRLDPVTGEKRWAHPLGPEDLSDRPDATVLDDQRFYWANDRTLSALTLKDGAPAWTCHLTGPESGWSLALTERAVLAYPLSSNVPGDGDGLPLVFRRRDDGGLVQRLLFPAVASDVTVRLAPGGALVATREGFWALGERR